MLIVSVRVSRNGLYTCTHLRAHDYISGMHKFDYEIVRVGNPYGAIRMMRYGR
jgi:hypothetical protein